MRRPEKMAELIRDEVIQIVGYELSDPRVVGVSVTEVRMADNLRDVRVFVAIEGSEQEAEAALVALRHAAPYVRRQVGTALSLRHTPEIHFVRDTAEENALRVDELLAGLAHDSAVAVDSSVADENVIPKERGEA